MLNLPDVSDGAFEGGEGEGPRSTHSGRGGGKRGGMRDHYTQRKEKATLVRLRELLEKR